MTAPSIGIEADRHQSAPVVDLSVVMPVYNEQEALPGVLEEAQEALRDVDFSYEILLVNDASTDHSPDILDTFQRENPSIVRVLHHPANRGITAACETLYDNARGRYVFINGSDGQWRTAECLRMMALRDHYDLIVGRRRRKRYDWRRQAISALFNWSPALLFGVRTYDAGSIKLFRRDVLNIPVISRGPFREAERIIRASDAEFRVGVIDVEHYSRHGGKAGGARLGLLMQSVMDLVHCWWELRFA
jgi:glycosyltransferase involved in cell wall biosynthesis